MMDNCWFNGHATAWRHMYEKMTLVERKTWPFYSQLIERTLSKVKPKLMITENARKEDTYMCFSVDVNK